MCGAHDAIYELTAYRDPNLLPIKAFYEPCPKVSCHLLLRISVYSKEEFRNLRENCYEDADIVCADAVLSHVGYR